MVYMAPKLHRSSTFVFIDYSTLWTQVMMYKCEYQSNNWLDFIVWVEYMYYSLISLFELSTQLQLVENYRLISMLDSYLIAISID